MEDPSITQQPKYVVGVGASAGGLGALERLFKSMPDDTGMAFVVIHSTFRQTTRATWLNCSQGIPPCPP
jgi:chemotaxis response regulator CheB